MASICLVSVASSMLMFGRGCWEDECWSEWCGRGGDVVWADARQSPHKNPFFYFLLAAKKKGPRRAHLPSPRGCGDLIAPCENSEQKNKETNNSPWRRLDRFDACRLAGCVACCRATPSRSFETQIASVVYLLVCLRGGGVAPTNDSIMQEPDSSETHRLARFLL